MLPENIDAVRKLIKQDNSERYKVICLPEIFKDIREKALKSFFMTMRVLTDRLKTSN